MTHIRLATLDEWIEGTFGRRERITVRGGFRGGGPTSVGTDLLELDGPEASTVRILLSRKATLKPVDEKAADVEFSEKAGGSENWWSVWASVLASSMLVTPVVDAIRLGDLLREPRRLRFFCDTNAFASGVAAWILHALEGQGDLVTSAVVDREFAAWPDRERHFWKAKTLDIWALRTSYRLGRRLTETPPRGVIVDRLSPDQGALMLSKLRDETEGEDGRRRKSPDADMLLIELARGWIRDQPRNARVVYLTGDRNNARAATNALGAENVLFAAADSAQAARAQGRVVARGWWRPGEPLGASVVPTTSRLLWDFLSACDYLVLKSAGQQWKIKSVQLVPGGVPSDWEDPWVEVVRFRPPGSQGVLPPAVPGSAPPAVPASVPPATATGSDEALPPPRPAEGRGRSKTARGPVTTSWLLPPVPPRPSLAGKPSARPFPSTYFPTLWQAISGKTSPDLAESSPAIQREVLGLLTVLEATDSSGAPGTRIEEFRRAWGDADLDWLHGEMLRLPGYCRAIEALRAGQEADPPSSGRAQISLARSLGQVARLTPRGAADVVGDAPIEHDALLATLERWLPRRGDTLSTNDLCRLALDELKLTPTRFERAMQLLWARNPEIPFDGQTGGTVVPGHAEQVVVLHKNGYEFTEIAPGNLSFGRSAPVRFVGRIR
ncbi:MAG: hypothetical protein Q8M65_09885 [Rhodoglobus sp.]|nr:hypothetical protein [Rhodoglobus sp.]